MTYSLPVRIFYLLVICLFAQSVYSQHLLTRKDSLSRIIQKASDDTVKINALIRLGTLIKDARPVVKPAMDSAMRFGNQALAISLRIKDLSRAGDSYDLLSRIFQAKEDHAKARDLEKRAISAYLQAKDHTGAGNAYKQLGGYFAYENPVELALRINYNKNALQEFIKAGNKQKQGYTCQELGNLYGLDNKQYLAIQYLKQGLAVYQTIRYPALQGLYYLLNEAYDQVGDYKQSIEYGLKAINTATIVGDASSQLCTIYNHVGKTYNHLRQFDKSEKYFRLALQIAERNRDNDSYDIVSLNLAELLGFVHKEREAIRILKTFKSTQDQEMIAIEYSAFLSAFTHLNEFGEAGRYYQKLKDELLHVDKTSYVKEIVNSDILTYLLAMKNYDEARSAIRDLEDISKYHASKNIQAANQQWLFRIDSAQGKYLSAIGHIEKAKRMDDSLITAKKNKYISELEVAYETENKKRELKLKTQAIELLIKQSELQKAGLQKAAIMRNVTVSGIIMLLLLLIISYNRYQLKQKSNVKLEEQQFLISKKNSSLEGLVNDKDKLITEKEWLLKEIHHRVKNNLQIVISLLNSQTVYLKNSDALEAILDSQHRVNSISLIHQKLYQSNNLARIDMNEYICDLVAYLKESFGIGNSIEMILEIEPVDLDVSLAVPLGLILNEAITNAIKYAFPADRRGRIEIALDEPLPGTIILSISDNGRGLPTDFDPDNSSSLGMSLMQGLSRQLNGRFELIKQSGLTLKITIERQPVFEEVNFTLQKDLRLADLQIEIKT
jgi:two-component sensor histidine kinase